MDDLASLQDAMHSYDKDMILAIQSKYLQLASVPTISDHRIDVDYSELATDELSKLLLPCDIPREHEEVLKVCKTLGNGNCLYNAVSLVLSGNNSLSTYLGILTACELYLNANRYINHDKVTETLLSPEFMTKDRRNAFAMVLPAGEISEDSFESQVMKEALTTCEDKKWSGLIHIMALSSVLGVPIRSVYPDTNIGIRSLFNGLVLPVGKESNSKNTIDIMWTRDSDLDNREGRVF